jgi:hypothetical protein
VDLERKPLGEELHDFPTMSTIHDDRMMRTKITSKIIDHRKHRLEEITEPLKNIRQRRRAGYTDITKFNRIFMKLAKCTKKGETRATLNTFKITSLFKREMKI